MEPSFIEDLRGVYLRGQAFNSTAVAILDRLDARDFDGAYAEFYCDGDKLPGYAEWGRRFVALLYANIGCRLHRTKNCQKMFCLFQGER